MKHGDSGKTNSLNGTTMEITYDSSGRMNYHPDFHTEHGKPLTEEELEYLCKYYEFDGRQMMSMALGKTEKVVSHVVNKLRKSGKFEYYRKLNKHW